MLDNQEMGRQGRRNESRSSGSGSLWKTLQGFTSRGNSRQQLGRWCPGGAQWAGPLGYGCASVDMRSPCLAGCNPTRRMLDKHCHSPREHCPKWPWHHSSFWTICWSIQESSVENHPLQALRNVPFPTFVFCRYLFMTRKSASLIAT